MSQQLSLFPELPPSIKSLTWPERIESYKRKLGTPYSYLSFQGTWCIGTWFMGNSYEKSNKYYGGFQGNFLKRIDALFPDRGKVLHLFAGQVDVSKFPGDTLDTRPELQPTYCVDAETCTGVPLDTYHLVLCDPPYSSNDAERYGKSMVNRNKVMTTLSEGLPSGAYVVWLDQAYPMYKKILLQPEAVIGIIGSTNHRFRVLTVFRKV